MIPKDSFRHIYKYFTKLLDLKNKISIVDSKNMLIYFLSFITILIAYLFVDKQLDIYKKKKQKNFNEIASSGELSKINNFFLDKLRSPYIERNYIIQNNDSIEKILNNFNIEDVDIKNIVNELKSRKLSNIYAGRKIKVISKKNQGNKDSIIHIIYPVSNTLSVEIRKNKNK